jgi:hypothetical protein
MTRLTYSNSFEDDIRRLDEDAMRRIDSNIRLEDYIRRLYQKIVLQG